MDTLFFPEKLWNQKLDLLRVLAKGVRTDRGEQGPIHRGVQTAVRLFRFQFLKEAVQFYPRYVSLFRQSHPLRLSLCQSSDSRTFLAAV